MKDQKKVLYDYLHITAKNVFIALGIAVGATLLEILVIISRFRRMFIHVVLVLAAIGGLIYIPVALNENLRLNKKIKQLELMGQLADLFNDFSAATQFMGDNVRVGRSFVFSKSANSFYGLSNISRIYVRQTSPANSTNYSIALLAEIPGEKRPVSLASSNDRASGETSLLAVLNAIVSCTPGILVGKQ